MTPKARLTRLFGIVVITVTFALAGAGFYVVRADVEAMREAGKENILWSAVQVELELMRFQRSLIEYANSDTAMTARGVNDRFDILWSRVSLFQQGSVGVRLTGYQSRSMAIERLFKAMKANEALIVGLGPDQRATATNLNAMFEPFSAELRKLSRQVLHGEQLVESTLREDLSDSSNILALLSGATVLVSLFLIVFLSRESSRFRTIAMQNKSLLDAATQANKAKSQFLTMMSHELRTPMNGVLGLLALAKQKGMDKKQQRLMEQAERSGQQMNNLLNDILDFSSLQDDDLVLETKPFEPQQLAQAVKEMFEPVAQREGIELTVAVDAACPAQVLGDFPRLRQSLTHMATYLLETAGIQRLRLDISYADGQLISAVSFDYAVVGGEWHPELIMGNVDRSGDNFASQALGPAVARGLIELMGGTTKLHNPSGDRIAVIISIPAEELVVDTLNIHIASQSAALAAICRAALSSDRVRFWDDGNTGLPHVVMIEAGGSNEAELVRAYTLRFPKAILVALGRPTNLGDFDDRIDLPIDVQNIHKSRFMRLAA